MKNVFDNGGYLGVTASYGKSPSVNFKGWRISDNQYGVVQTPQTDIGDLIVVAGVYGGKSVTVPTGWTVTSSGDGGFVAYKYATAANETVPEWGPWYQSPKTMLALVFSGPVSLGANGVTNSQGGNGTVIQFPSVGGSDFTGNARRFRIASFRKNQNLASSWSTLSSQFTSLYESATIRFCEEKSTVGSAKTMNAGTITTADYLYWGSATIEIRSFT